MIAEARRVALVAPLLALSLGCERKTVPPSDTAARSPNLMTPQDLQALPSKEPDQRVSYGKDSSQYGELRIPAGAGHIQW
jgi:hypothetical protein